MWFSSNTALHENDQLMVTGLTDTDLTLREGKLAPAPA